MDHKEPQNKCDQISGKLETLTIEDSSERLRSDLLKQCQQLLDELEQFQEYIVKQKKYSNVELRHFKNSVKTEKNSLEKLSLADPSAQRTVHTLRSSNLPFYAAVWDCAKNCAGIIALEKRYYWTPDGLRNDKAKFRGVVPPQHKRYSVLVDVVAQNGSEWVKVSTLTEKRLLFDMAKAGWADGSSSEGSEFGHDSHDEPEGLLKQAEALAKASKATRVRYRRPKIRIVLPKITRGGAKEVEELIMQIEALGIKVQTSSDDLQDSRPLLAILPRLVVDPFDGLSETINVDCTILLAIVSDLSHGRVEAERWHHRAVLRQIEMESESQLLPISLWPAMGSRNLVCTHEAAKRMHEIVDLIGTKSEKQRRDCLMEVKSTTHWSRKQRTEAFQDLSSYEVPLNWNIPIVAVGPELNVLLQQLPPAAVQVTGILSPINQSVFLYGWATGLTTISSNRTVAKEIEATIETHRLGEDDVGPDIWLCPTARSLVGKEKTRRD